MPFGRSGHCAVALGDAMYVMGGITTDTVPSELKFDSRTQAWSEVAPMPEAIAYAGACVVGSDVYFLGGHRPDTSISATTFCYNTGTDAWSTLAPMPEAKAFHSVCAIGGLIYVLGGNSGISASVHCFDPVGNSWSAVAPMSIARSKCTSFVLDGSLYAAGGEDVGKRVASVERYDVTSNSWCTVAPMGQVRSRSCAHAIHVEVNLFDSLLLKAKVAQR
jgi:N-acetylneuraminic acid mutarotase